MNHPLRAINVLTFSLLLILTGCMGLVPEEADPVGDADAEDAGTSSSAMHANAPVVSLNWNSVVTDNRNATGVLESVTMSVYHAAVDADGDIVEMGYDLDLDGTIDVNVTAMHGWTTFNQTSANFVEHPTDHVNVTTVAFIARDSTGLAGTELISEAVPVWWTGTTLYYIFDAEDAGGDVTTQTDDNLVRVTMTQGGDINWAFVSVTISVNNGAPITCDRDSGDGVDTDCKLVEFGDSTDSVWSVGDGVTIVENGQDLCTAGATCGIEVTVTNVREGNTMDESSTVAQ
jgi:hypothetical protein